MLDTGAQKQSSSESNAAAMDVPPSAGSAESGTRTTFSSAGPLPPVANAGAMAGPSASDLAYGAQGGDQVANAASAAAPQAAAAANGAKAAKPGGGGAFA